MKMALKTTDCTEHKQECSEVGILIRCWWENEMGQPFWKNTGQLLIKLNIPLPYDPAIHSAVFLLRKWKLYSHKSLYMNVFSVSIHESHKLEMTQVSIHGWIAKQVVVHSSHEILPSNIKKWMTETCSHLDDSQKHYAQWKKAVSKAYVLYKCIYIIHKRTEYRIEEQINDCHCKDREMVWL